MNLFFISLETYQLKTTIFTTFAKRKSVILTYKRRLKFSSSFLLTFLFSHVFWHLNGLNRWFVICFKLHWTWKMFSLDDMNSQKHASESISQSSSKPWTICPEILFILNLNSNSLSDFVRDSVVSSVWKDRVLIFRNISFR